MNRREAKQRALQHASNMLRNALGGWEMDDEYPDAADQIKICEEIETIADRLKDRADSLADEPGRIIPAMRLDEFEQMCADARTHATLPRSEWAAAAADRPVA